MNVLDFNSNPSWDGLCKIKGKLRNPISRTIWFFNSKSISGSFIVRKNVKKGESLSKMSGKKNKSLNLKV